MRVADATKYAWIGQGSLERAVFGSECVAKAVDLTRENFDSSRINRMQALLAGENVQRRAALRAGFGEDQRAARKIESRKTLPARQLCLRRPPVQTPRNHQVQHQPQIALHSNRDAFADAPQLAHGAALNTRQRRLYRAQ